jgi:hypothetical protein
MSNQEFIQGENRGFEIGRERALKLVDEKIKDFKKCIGLEFPKELKITKKGIDFIADILIKQFGFLRQKIKEMK